MAKGRGRLSGIEQLPPEADQIIAAAATALQDRERTQLDIYEEFFNALNTLKREHRGELEFSIPSFSAFNRYSIRLATLTRRLEETREIAAAVSKRFGVEESDNLALITAETLKTLVFELLTSSKDKIDPKGAQQLASALYRATQAQGVSTARRQKVEREFAEKVSETVDQVAKVAGLSAERASEIRKQVLGLRS